MPSRRALNVSMTDELCEFVARQVKSGRFQTSSEVVRAALRLLEREAEASHTIGKPGVHRESLAEAGDGASASKPRDGRS
jgi:putative addiction module CopG family antidote